MMAVPPGSSPAKISALAAAMPSSEPKDSRCAGAMVVMTAMCGRTNCVSGVISPAALMPISKTPNCAVSGMRASISGTPQ